MTSKEIGLEVNDDKSKYMAMSRDQNAGRIHGIKTDNRILSSSLLFQNLKIKIYRNIIFPVFLYGCKTWSLKLREERRLRVFENTALRRIFGPKRDEVTMEWRKLLNEELKDLYSCPVFFG